MSNEFKLGDRVRTRVNSFGIPSGLLGTVVSSYIRPTPAGFQFVDVLLDDEGEHSTAVLEDGTRDPRWPFARFEIEVIHG